MFENRGNDEFSVRSCQKIIGIWLPFFRAFSHIANSSQKFSGYLDNLKGVGYNKKNMRYCGSGVEQLTRNEQVVGSNPTSSSTFIFRVKCTLFVEGELLRGVQG